MMSRVKMGMIAGLAATAAIFLLEAVNLLLGPWVVSFPRLLSVTLQMPDNVAVGWIAHAIAGTLVLGPLFALMYKSIPGQTPEAKGITFSVAAFVVLSLTVAPLAGVGMFFMRAGFVALAWMILTHALFGVVMGNVMARLMAREKRGPVVIGGAAVH